MSSRDAKYDPLRELAEQYCDGTLSPEQIAALERQLRDDPQALDYFVLYMEIHSQLAWNVRANTEGATKVENRGGEPDAVDASDAEDAAWSAPAVGATVESAYPFGASLSGEKFLAPSTAPTSPIVLDLSPPATQTPSFFAPGGMLFSYGISAILVGVGLVLGWVCQMPQHATVAKHTPAVPVRAGDPEMTFVAQVTGMVDCQWSDPATATALGAHVPRDRRFSLAAGLLEITYATGARIILQGPLEFQADSDIGGSLERGRLTARVDKAVAGRKPAAAANPKATKPSGDGSPYCTIRTPTATITDLGTEFGVEVDAKGQTETRVFQGKVRIVRAGDDSAAKAPGRAMILNAGQSARCDVGRQIVLSATPDAADRFVRTLRPRPVESVHLVESFDNATMHPAFEQSSPGQYLNIDGAAVYQQASLEKGEQLRGYIRTVATDFCNRDFVFEATLHVSLENPDESLQPHGHYIFFGIGDGMPNARFFDEVTRGLILAYCADNGWAFVRLCRPEAKLDDTDTNVAQLASPGSLPLGRHRFRMTKIGKNVQFAIDADFQGEFHQDFVSPPIHLPTAATLLNASNSRLLVGTGNCDTMRVRFEELSITLLKSSPPQKLIEDKTADLPQPDVRAKTK